MDYTYDDLKNMTVAQLREAAKGEVQGYSQMNKEKLIKALCDHWDIEMHHIKHVVGIDKSAVKNKIKELKKKRDAALEAHDSKALKLVRRKIHALKVKLHRFAK